MIQVDNKTEPTIPNKTDDNRVSLVEKLPLSFSTFTANQINSIIVSKEGKVAQGSTLGGLKVILIDPTNFSLQNEGQNNIY